MDKNVTAVCISRQMENWGITEVPFLCYTEDWKPFGHEKSKARVAYLAARRNKAVALALSLFPATRHILMIDSYYLNQDQQIRQLIAEYFALSLNHDPMGCIVGASTWIFDKTKLRSKHRFYDYWTTPEGLGLKLSTAEKQGGLFGVKAVGGCYLYPRSVWEREPYDVPDDLHGCEHNWLCEHADLPVLLSLNERLWREPIVYPWPKRFRSSLHIGRFLRH